MPSPEAEGLSAASEALETAVRRWCEAAGTEPALVRSWVLITELLPMVPNPDDPSETVLDVTASDGITIHTQLGVLRSGVVQVEEMVRRAVS